jgi:SET domain-containing protein
VPPAEPEPDCWIHPDVVVARSAIAGRGLFARAPIPAGTTVSRLGGRLAPTAELDSVVAASETYVDSITVGEDVHLVLPSMTANHFTNHSCDPNLWWADEYTLVARRDVGAGEELTSDYATSSNHPGLAMACHCGSYRCRQLITGDDWRIPQLQQRYAGHWVPYLQSLIAEAQ